MKGLDCLDIKGKNNGINNDYLINFKEVISNNVEPSYFLMECEELNNIPRLKNANKKGVKNNYIYNDLEYSYISDAILTDNLDNIVDSELNIENEITSKIFNEDINSLLRDTLKEREYKILKMSYGLEGTQPMTYRAIADELGMTYQRVGQVMLEIKVKLRKNYKLRNKHLNR